MKIWKWLTAREHRLVFCGILAAFVATVAYAGVIVHGQLIDASLENLSSDPTSHTGRVYWNTSTLQAKIHNGTAWTSLGAGNGAGAKNYISNGTNSATGWAASGAGITCTTASASLPDPSLNTALGLTGVSGSTAFCYYTFKLDDADFGKKLALTLDQYDQSAAANDFRIDVCACNSAWSGGSCSSGTVAQGCGTNATRLALSTDSSSVTTLPALTGTFRSTFDAPSGLNKYIQVQAGLNQANTNQLNLAQVYAGPGIVTQGYAGQDLGAMTVTVSGNGSKTFTNTANGWREGDNLRIKFFLVGNSTASGSAGSTTFVMNLPTGYTINTAALPAGAGNEGTALGRAQAYGVATASQYDAAASVYAASTTSVAFIQPNTVGNVYTIKELNVARAVEFFGEVVIPVNEWAGGGTVNVVQNDCEYAYNTSTSDAADTSSFAYGPAGGAFPGGLTANRSKRVRFITTISSTDKESIEVDPDGAGDWPVITESRIGGTNDGTHGMTWQRVSSSSTDIDVSFGSAGFNATTLTSAAAWSTLSSGKWRVKKCAGGQAVGFGAATSISAGLAPAGFFTAGLSNSAVIQPSGASPASPSSSNEVQVYVRGSKIVFGYNDAGTVRYKYLDLSGTGVTWVHTTTPP